ncbi:hypothetical protein [Novosphingobium sp. YAF33]|uniref:hypothetical protein n=1 Tax=Novosphingobium sp. YAF33 TaxID=3233082 RepID=UPI003F9B46B4
MKILKLSLALAALAGGLGIAATADAHPRDHHRYEERRHHYRDYRRYDRPRHWSGHRYRENHRRCWTEWRHHHKVRVCR